MDKIVVEGGKKLYGEVNVSGAKNAALPLMATAILTRGEVCLSNVPNLQDLLTMAKLLKYMGGEIKFGNGEACMDMSGFKNAEAPYELVKTMRASSLVLGPLLARYGEAKVSLPGGCAIGERPIDLHLKALELMGATINIDGGYVVGRSPKGGLRGAEINFDSVTVTGTENIMMAATLAKGRTILNNAACEPEVSDTAKALLKMGAKIEGLGTSTLIIEGVNELYPINYEVMPDRIEAGTLIVAVAIAGGKVIIKNSPHKALEAVYEKLKKAGISLEIKDKDLIVKGEPKDILPIDMVTEPYPHFPTDMQAQFMALMCLAQGTSEITETIFENRFMHVSELKRLGADITLDGRTALVCGVKKLSAAPVMATDLRASASLVLAALAAVGQTTITRVYHLDRGYDRLDNKLKQLGANIYREKG